MTPQHPPDGFLISEPEPPRLKPDDCPGFKDVKIQVLDEDTLDAAILLLNNTSTTADETKENAMAYRPCILNMASERNPGGAWLGGAATQEEAICRRSTLILTLPRKFYPIPATSAVYSPSVVVFRKGVFKDYHELLDLEKPDLLPVISVVSAAAPRRPKLSEVTLASTSGQDPVREQRYLFDTDRDLMKEKIRVVLRISAWKGHRQLVLGAFGCGAFGNPKQEVARCWKEVFGETEFQGGWWSSVVFAIIDNNKRLDGNVALFRDILDGVAV
jgi:uncharacterized protein (TIGR02452 family)